MTTITQFLAGDHQSCDALFAQAEQLVAEGAWSEARGSFETFNTCMEHHFRLEEQTLFPAFESATGNRAGPTEVMRHEHRQMRLLLEEMAQALDGERADPFLGAAETLLILMQQHNGKEEQILYPMADRALGPDGAAQVRNAAEG